jgi:outer membrane protein OmpA-like peptidoglycan-associated protein
MNHEEEYHVQGYDHAFSSEPLFQDHPYEDEAHAASTAQPPAAHSGYQEEGYEEEAYEADENFPEPANEEKEKKKLSKGMTMAIAGISVVVIGLGCAYIYDPDMVTNAPGQLIAMVTGGEPGSEPAPEPAVAKPHHKKLAGVSGAAGARGDGTDTPVAAHPHPKPLHPVVSKPAADGAAKPAPALAKTDGLDGKPAVKSAKPGMGAKKPMAVAAVAAVAAVPTKPGAHVKPHPAAKPKLPNVSAKPVVPAMAAASGGSKTAIGFAAGSYWVAASEIEHLWSYTSGLKANSGQFTVESWVSGAEADGLNLSRKRANRVAELLTKNTPAHAFKVTVKIHGAPAAKTAARKVAITFTNKL